MSYIVNVTLTILKGCITTLEIYAVTAVLSFPLGIAGALGKASRFKILRKALDIYTLVIRGTPLMLQIFFAYYGLPTLGITFSPFSAAAITFVINYAAYLTEIFRAGIESIDRGQYEAARVLGMNYFQTMRRVILPQAVRRVLPPTCNESINLIKDTALLSVISMGDLLQAAKEAVTRDFNITPFFIAAAVYLIMTSVMIAIFKKLENKYSVYE